MTKDTTQEVMERVIKSLPKSKENTEGRLSNIEYVQVSDVRKALTTIADKAKSEERAKSYKIAMKWAENLSKVGTDLDHQDVTDLLKALQVK